MTLHAEPNSSRSRGIERPRNGIAPFGLRYTPDGCDQNRPSATLPRHEPCDSRHMLRITWIARTRGTSRSFDRSATRLGSAPHPRPLLPKQVWGEGSQSRGGSSWLSSSGFLQARCVPLVEVAAAIRGALIVKRESLIFETVLIRTGAFRGGGKERKRWETLLLAGSVRLPLRSHAQGLTRLLGRPVEPDGVLLAVPPSPVSLVARPMSRATNLSNSASAISDSFGSPSPSRI